MGGTGLAGERTRSHTARFNFTVLEGCFTGMDNAEVRAALDGLATTIINEQWPAGFQAAVAFAADERLHHCDVKHMGGLKYVLSPATIH